MALAGNCQQRLVANDGRALVTDEVIVAGCGAQTPGGRTLDVAAG